jgi:uncharacterized SAM-binding protein YcdF (DUF218 family)
LFFVLSKVLSPLLNPLTALLILQAAGLLLATRWRRFGIALAAACTVTMLVVVTTPFAPVLMYRLEQTVPRPARLPDKIDGIVLLGGAQDPAQTEAYGEPHFGSSGTMVFTFLALARRYPEAKLVFTGGSGELMPGRLSEGDVMRLLASQQGLDTSRLLVEDKSRNTHENAVLGKKLAAPAPGQTWLLVAAARHMPRAVAVFEKQQWPVVPYPTAYRAYPNAHASWGFEPTRNFEDLNSVVHEWLGSVVYQLTDRI